VLLIIVPYQQHGDKFGFIPGKKRQYLCT